MKTSTGKSWFRIENRADEAAQVYLYDEIGSWGTSANDFVKELRDLKASAIDVHVNSPGGECYDGLAIFNALRSHKANVTVYIDGLAASAASFVAMAGDRIVAERNASLMIHNAHAVGVGDADDMRKMADMLDRMSATIADIYAERAGGTSAQWRDRMKTETWFSAEEARTAGLVDEVTTSPPPRGMPRNTWDLSIFNFAGRDKAPDPFAPRIVGEAGPEVLLDMACPAHDTATMDGTWDAGANEGRMPSPMPVAMAKKMYGWYDAARVEDGQLPKAAGKLPHHEVSADGSPGAANLAGVRNALARLSQTDIPEADMAAVQAHLRAHLAAGQASDHAPPPGAEVHNPPDEAGFLMPALDPAVLRDAITALVEIPFDPELFRAAVALVANDAPAPDQTPPADPVPPEPELSIDLPAFRRSIREARL